MYGCEGLRVRQILRIRSETLAPRVRSWPRSKQLQQLPVVPEPYHVMGHSERLTSRSGRRAAGAQDVEEGGEEAGVVAQELEDLLLADPQQEGSSGAP